MTDTLMDAPSRALEKQEVANKIRLISVDCVVFALIDKRLNVLLLKEANDESSGKWSLPSSRIYEHESLEDSAKRQLLHLTNHSDTYIEQLCTFSDLGRIPGERVISTAFIALLPPEEQNLASLASKEAKWFEVDALPSTVFDHSKIVQAGLKHLRRGIQFEPVGIHLLPNKFTLGQLQDLYEAVLDERLDKPNFRRKILRMDFLTKSNETQKKVPHRAGTLYTFDAQHYAELCNQGFVFKF